MSFWTPAAALLIRADARGPCDDASRDDGAAGRARREPREAPPLAVPLRAGPLRLVFDRGELRWIRLGEREVLRGIYVAVREPGWATVPGAHRGPRHRRPSPTPSASRFVARHERGDVRFDWEARIEGTADGRIVYAIDGAAGATFLRNRIGFCVLHPASECAGDAVRRSRRWTDGRARD